MNLAKMKLEFIKIVLTVAIQIFENSFKYKSNKAWLVGVSAGLNRNISEYRNSGHCLNIVISYTGFY